MTTDAEGGHDHGTQETEANQRERPAARRWSKHLGPFFGHKLPDEVNVADVRRFVEGLIAAGKSPATARLCVALLGSLYTDLVEREIVAQNVVRALPRAVRRLMKPAGTFAPFLERQDDIRRLYLELPQPFATIYAVGVLPTLSVDLSRPAGDVIEMAAHRAKKGAGEGTVRADLIDEAQTDSISSDNNSPRAHSSAGRAADF